MKCTDINKHIDGFIDGELAAIIMQAFEQHIAKCTDCAQKIEAARALRTALHSNLAAPLPSAGFEQRIFAEVRKHYKKESSHSFGFKFATGFSAAAVASLMIWVVSTVSVPNGPAGQPQMIAVAMNQTQPVKLMFDSRSEIKHAKLTVDLPDNVTLEGYPGRRELSWPTNLNKGKNVLALPIEAVRAGQGELRVELDYNQKVKTFRVVLKTTNNTVH